MKRLKRISPERENKLLKKLLADTMRLSRRTVTSVEISAEGKTSVRIVITAPWAEDEDSMAALIAGHINLGWKTLGEDAERLEIANAEGRKDGRNG